MLQDLNNAVAFYLESGGVGHGNHGVPLAGGWDAGAAFVQEPEEGLVQHPVPAGAAAFPRSQPIEVGGPLVIESQRSRPATLAIQQHC